MPSTAQAQQLSGEYRDLVARKVSEAMRRPVRIAVSVPVGVSSRPDVREEKVQSLTTTVKIGQFDHVEMGTPNFIVTECGLPNAQVWAAVIDEIVATGEVSRLNVETWLRSSRLLGRGAGGSLIVGAVHLLAQRRIVERFLYALSAAVAAVLGAECKLEIVVAKEWQSEHANPPVDGGLEEIGAA